MNKYIVDELLPAAVNACSGIKDDGMRNNLSALGATIIMSGLLPAMAVYSKKEKKDTLLLLEKIGKDVTVCKLIPKLYEVSANCKPGEIFAKALDMRNNNGDMKQLEEDVINCIIALKLALDACVKSGSAEIGG